jgi:hypothetical protein
MYIHKIEELCRSADIVPNLRPIPYGAGFLAILVAMLLLLTFPVASLASTLTLNCDNAEMGSTNEKAAEARLLLKASGKASRLSEHMLQVTAAGRVLSFRDVPNDEALMDVRYTFCGSQDGYSLVGWADGDVFTGKLIEEKSGRVLPDGLQVIFSPDRRAYLAVEQEDGIDGTDWTVHFADSGKVSWKGNSFIPSKTTSIDLDNPRWTDKGELIANARCWDNPDATARLVNTRGTWSWHVPKDCNT